MNKSKFKVGDLVRIKKDKFDSFINKHSVSCDKTYEIIISNDSGLIVIYIYNNYGQKYWIFHERLELVNPDKEDDLKLPNNVKRLLLIL